MKIIHTIPRPVKEYEKKSHSDVFKYYKLKKRNLNTKSKELLTKYKQGLIWKEL